MKLWISRFTMVDALNFWLSQNDVKISDPNGATYKGSEIEAIDIDLVSGDFIVTTAKKPKVQTT